MLTGVSGQALTVAGRQVVQGRCLADGGFAYVYEARDRQTGEVLALRKVLCQDAERLAANNAEIALLKRLPAHPHIVRFYGGEAMRAAHTASQEVVSLFEFCSGGTLLAHLEAQLQALAASSASGAAASTAPRHCCPCLPESDVLDVLQGIAGALAHMHEQAPPIVHYDVKSENILLGADAKWKLCDFGSASETTLELAGKPRRAVLEAEEFVNGRCTPIYRAPEVADVYLRWPIGPKVDVFALGCVLFATVTAVHPFPLDSALANIQANFRLPPEMASVYSSAISIWVRRTLAREPADRPMASELCREIQRFREVGEEPPHKDASASSATVHADGSKPQAQQSRPPPVVDPWSMPAMAADQAWQADFGFAAEPVQPQAQHSAEPSGALADPANAASPTEITPSSQVQPTRNETSVESPDGSVVATSAPTANTSNQAQAAADADAHVARGAHTSSTNEEDIAAAAAPAAAANADLPSVSASRPAADTALRTPVAPTPSQALPSSAQAPAKVVETQPQAPAAANRLPATPAAKGAGREGRRRGGGLPCLCGRIRTQD